MSWLKYESPWYARQISRWRQVQAFYEGDIQPYILQHKQGESLSSFQERLELSDFEPLLATVIESVSGVLFERENEVERQWGRLGSPERPGTAAYSFWRDADGQGTDYPVLLRRMAVQLLLYDEAWLLVDGPHVKLVNPMDVPNYLLPYEVLVKETIDSRGSILEKPELRDQYILYFPDRWQRFRLTSDSNIVTTGAKEILVAEGLHFPETGRMYVDRNEEPTTPLVRVRLPWQRYVAHQLSESVRIYTNNLSDRDHALRSSSFPKLTLAADDDLYDKLVGDLKAGSNVLQRPILDNGTSPEHSYIAPPETTAAATEVLKEKRQAFFDAAWRVIESEARIAQTATEAAMKRSSGLASALSMLSASIQEAENSLLYLLAQSHSDRPVDWEAVSVDWSVIDYATVSLTDDSPTQ